MDDLMQQGIRLIVVTLIRQDGDDSVIDVDFARIFWHLLLDNSERMSQDIDRGRGLSFSRHIKKGLGW